MWKIKSAGLGRLVKVDDKNIVRNPYKKSTFWCFPFENLLAFYILRFGFKNYLKGIVLDRGRKNLNDAILTISMKKSNPSL